MFWVQKANSMLMRLVILSFTLMITLVSGHALSAPKSDKQKKLILMGGSELALRNSAKQDAEIAFNAVLDETVINPDIRIQVSVYPTATDIYAAFDKGEIDGIFGTPLEYMRRMDELGEGAMALFYKGSGVKQSFVLIARNEDIRSQISDLRGKRLTLAKFQDIEELYLNTLLLRNQLPEIPDFFSERLDARNSNIAIMDVFFNKSDVAIVREGEFKTAIELNPQIGKKLVVIDKSVPFLPAIGGIRNTYDKALIDKLMTDIERVSDTTKGSKVLTLTQATSIVSVSRDEMRSVLDLSKEYERLKKSSMQKAVSAIRSNSKDRRHAH